MWAVLPHVVWAEGAACECQTSSRSHLRSPRPPRGDGCGCGCGCGYACGCAAGARASQGADAHMAAGGTRGCDVGDEAATAVVQGLQRWLCAIAAAVVVVGGYNRGGERPVAWHEAAAAVARGCRGGGLAVARGCGDGGTARGCGGGGMSLRRLWHGECGGIGVHMLSPRRCCAVQH